MNYPLFINLFLCFCFVINSGKCDDYDDNYDDAIEYSVADDETDLNCSEPIISNLISSDITSTRITLGWTIDDEIDCENVSYNIRWKGYMIWDEGTSNSGSTSTTESKYTVVNLVPLSNYTFSVVAQVNQEDVGIVLNLTENTLEGEPGPPTDVMTSNLTSSSLYLSWIKPPDQNGIISSYLVSWFLSDNQKDLGKNSAQTNKTFILIEDLAPCGKYRFDVQASTGAAKYGDPSTTEDKLLPAVPPPVTNLSAVTVESRSANLAWSAPDTYCLIKEYSLTGAGGVLWENFTDGVNVTFNGNQTTYLLHALIPQTLYNLCLIPITADFIGNESCISFTTEEDIPEPPQIVDVTDDDIRKRHITIKWMAPNVTNGMLTRFNVTWSSSFLYVPYTGDTVYTLEIDELETNQQYNISVAAATSAGFGRASFVTVSTLNNALAITLGVLIPVVLIVALLAFGYVYRDDIKTKMDTFRQTYPASEYDEIGEVNLAPIPLKQLSTYINKIKDESVLKNEFACLKAASYNGSTREAEKSHNHLKNRYANILAYDETRVHLVNGYINANYINSFDQSKFFVAAQGPKDETLEDFWNLIWQENVDVIVNLTSCVEEGKEKCAQYWPNCLGYGIDLGDFSIQNINEEATNVFTLRMIEMTHRSQSLKRLMKQYQFCSWQDHGPPSRDEDLLRLIQNIKRNMNAKRPRNKMLVHCSAGVGRTGTFIALWNLIEEIDEGRESVTFNKEILSLRRQRVMMVQSPQQYLSLHNCVLAYYRDRFKWKVQERAVAPSVYTEDEGSSSDCVYSNPAFEANQQEFEGNLI